MAGPTWIYSSLLKVNEVVVEVLLRLKMLFYKDVPVKDLLNCATVQRFSDLNEALIQAGYVL